MSGDKAFVDSNILVYAHDASHPEKRARSRQIVASALAGASAAVSGQVLGEFVTVVTRKVAQPLSLQEAAAAVDLLSPIEVVPVDRALVKHALLLQQEHQTSYWDAQILAAAHRAGCSVVLSEDLGHGRRYGSVEVRNPFVDTDAPA